MDMQFALKLFFEIRKASQVKLRGWA